MEIVQYKERCVFFSVSGKCRELYLDAEISKCLLCFSPPDCLGPAAAQVSSAVPFSSLLTTASLTLIWAPRQRYIKIDDMSQLCKMFTLT